MTKREKSGRIRLLQGYISLVSLLKDNFKSLLPKGVADREALNSQLLNIKPRLIPLFYLGFRRLKILLLVALLLGYFPNINYPQSQGKVLAEGPQVSIDVASLSKPLQLPHPGYLSTRFSYYHPGIDLATGLGMPIRPITDGVVEAVNWDFLGYGHHVIIAHEQGLKSLYGHMGKIYVKVGQTVDSNTIIGEVGLTGHTSGPHTHLEITKDGKYIDPLTVLPPVEDFPKTEYLVPVGGSTSDETLHKNLKPNL